MYKRKPFIFLAYISTKWNPGVWLDCNVTPMAKLKGGVWGRNPIYKGGMWGKSLSLEVCLVHTFCLKDWMRNLGIRLGLLRQAQIKRGCTGKSPPIKRWEQSPQVRINARFYLLSPPETPASRVPLDWRWFKGTCWKNWNFLKNWHPIRGPMSFAAKKKNK